MDDDNLVKCWIHDLPYIWRNNSRYYLPINSGMIVYVENKGKICPINYTNITLIFSNFNYKNYVLSNLEQHERPLYFFYWKKNSNCKDIVKYFQVYNQFEKKLTKDEFQKLDLRINGTKIPINQELKLYEYPSVINTRKSLTKYKILVADYNFIELKTIDDSYLENAGFNPDLYPDILKPYAQHYKLDKKIGVHTYSTYLQYLYSVFDNYESKLDKYPNLFKHLISGVYKIPLMELLKKKIKKTITNDIYETIINDGNDDKAILLKLKSLVKHNGLSTWGADINNPLIITNRAKSRINDFKKFIPEGVKKVLDIGAGNCELIAGFGNYLKIQKENLWAVDIKNYCNVSMSTRLQHLAVKPGEKIPLEDSQFDLILLLQTAHHIGDINLKLKEINRLLKPGGYLFMREHDCRNMNIRNLIDIEHIIYDVIYENKSYEYSVKEYKNTCYRSSENWIELLKDNGFELVHIEIPNFYNNPTLYYNSVFQKILK